MISLRRGVSSLASIVRRATRIPPRELLTTIRALVVLTALEASIRWIPLPRLGRLLGVRFDLTPPTTGVAPMPLDSLPPPAQRALRATKRVTRWSPFCSGPCLRRSLVSAHLLRRLDPAVRLGVAGGDGGIRAHAWIEIDHRPLEDVGEYSSFNWPSHSDVSSAAS